MTDIRKRMIINSCPSAHLPGHYQVCVTYYRRMTKSIQNRGLALTCNCPVLYFVLRLSAQFERNEQHRFPFFLAVLSRSSQQLNFQIFRAPCLGRIISSGRLLTQIVLCPAQPSFALPPAPPAPYVLPAAAAPPHAALGLATHLYEPPTVVAKPPPPPPLASLVSSAPLYDAVVAASTSSGVGLAVVGGATSGSSSGGASRLTPELQAVAGSPVPLDYSSQAALGEEYIDVQGTATAGHS